MDECRTCRRKIKQERRGRPRFYCSDACKQRAYDRRRLAAAEQAGRETAIDELRNRKFLA